MRPPEHARILIAMSGGVDSAVAAKLLVEQGYDCVGVTMRLVPEHPGKSVFEPCCGLQAVEDARRVCDKLGIPHESMHAVERFERDIIANFTEEYLSGRTPNPCVRCNRMIKFGALYRKADELGAGYVAMGHYARLELRGARLSLRRAVHRPKDQSYVLAPLTQAQLRRAHFPLGALTKADVRALAWKLDFRMANKPESQEICFVPENDYRAVVQQRGGGSLPGPLLDTAGNVIGTHKGILHYTLGQRRGLGLNGGLPYYVVRIDAARNAVVVGHEEATYCDAFETGSLCWGGMAPVDSPFDCRVQLRSRHDAAPCTVAPSRGGAAIRLHEAQRAVTPGQWAVFYDTDGFVLASGMIRAFSALHTPQTLAG